MTNVPYEVRLFGDEFSEWSAGRTNVVYKPRLNGFGTIEALWYVDFIRRRFDRTFKKVFEWCAGPGFIGFALLDAGLCENLCLADINEDAVDCIKRTIAKNPHLAGRVSYYLSDNLKQIPRSEKFDLVVGNPPYAYKLNQDASSGWAGDLRPHDFGWEIHREFYATIKEHLIGDDSFVCISELSPLEQEPILSLFGSKPWDIRPRPPIVDFCAQISAGGLKLMEVVRAGGAEPYAVVSPMGRVMVSDHDWFWILVSVPNKY